MPVIRLADTADAAQVRAIYAPFCGPDSHVSFEYGPPTVAEMERRIAETLPRFPWLVADRAGVVLGSVHAGPHSARAAYRWSANVSVYIADGHRGAGVGRALYTSLFAILKLQGFVIACAGATLPNPASVGLHESMGFHRVGIYRGIGFKAGKWHDTVWWQRPLADPPERPDPPLSLAEAQSLPGWGAAIEAGASFFR